MFHPRLSDCGTYDPLRHLFLQWATAYFPLCAWFNSPYAYHVRVISLFIAILLSWAQHVLLAQACGLCLAARQRFKHRLQMATAAMGYNVLKRRNALCVREIYRWRFRLSFCFSFWNGGFKHRVSLREVIKIVRRTKTKRFMELVTSYQVCT